jgi:drug/metabolite transporter (DMT)-like permease
VTRRDFVRVHASLLGVQVLFGLWPVAGAAVLGRITPGALVGYRLLLGAPLLALAARLFSEKLPSLSDLGRLAMLGAFGIAINQLLFVEGLSRAGPVNASLSILLLPAITLVIAALLGHERANPVRWVGVALAFVGAGLLVHVERFDLGNRAAVGNMMLVANVASYAMFIVLARPVFERLGALRGIAWVFVFGGLEALPFTLGDVFRTEWSTLPLWAWGSLAFILFGATLATYILNAYALRRVESSVVAVYVYVQPIIASVASWLVLDVTPTLRTLIAGSIIVVGVAVSSEIPKLIAGKSSVAPPPELAKVSRPCRDKSD